MYGLLFDDCGPGGALRDWPGTDWWGTVVANSRRRRSPDLLFFRRRTTGLIAGSGMLESLLRELRAS